VRKKVRIATLTGQIFFLRRAINAVFLMSRKMSQNPVEFDDSRDATILAVNINNISFYQ